MPNWEEIEKREKRLAEEHQANIDREVRQKKSHEERAAEAARHKGEESASPEMAE